MNREEIRELANFRPGGNLASLCLDTGPAIDSNREYRAFLGGLLAASQEAS